MKIRFKMDFATNLLLLALLFANLDLTFCGNLWNFNTIDDNWHQNRHEIFNPILPLDNGKIFLQKNQSNIGIQGSQGRFLNFTVQDYVPKFSENGRYYRHSTTFQSEVCDDDAHKCNLTKIEFTDLSDGLLVLQWNSIVEICMQYQNDECNLTWQTFGAFDDLQIQPYVWFNSDGFGIVFREPYKVHWRDSTKLCIVPKLLKIGNSLNSIKIYDSPNFNFPNQIPDSRPLQKIYPNIKLSKSLQENVFKFPIWSYTIDQDLSGFVAYLKETFKVSLLEININWQKHDGDFAFDLDRLPDPKMFFAELNKLGLRTSIRVNPFISKKSTNFERFKFLMIKDTQSFVFDENVGGILNLNRSAVSNWFMNKLTQLSDDFQIDSLTFGARKFGNFNENLFLRNFSNPQTDNQISLYYQTNRASLLSPLKMPLFVQIDIKANRNFAHNLKSLIPMALSMSLSGHHHIVPNLVVNEAEKPSIELFIRWVQAVTFMPVMKLQIGPWIFNQTFVRITNQFVNLHAQIISDQVGKIEKTSYRDVQPIIQPLWHAFPDDRQTYSIDDQFMLGNDILVAPVLEEGQRERSVYFPKGVWIDQHDNGFTGPGRFVVQAPLYELPYFKLFEKSTNSEL